MKYVDSDLLPRMKKPWWYGYGGKVVSAAEGFLDFQFAKGVGARLNGAHAICRTNDAKKAIVFLGVDRVSFLP